MQNVTNNNVVFNIANWYLQDTKMAFLPPSLVGSSHHHDGFQYLYTGTSSIDLINFGGNFSLELLRFGKSWQETLRNVKLKSLVVLVGAGGLILYLLRRSRPPSSSSWPGQGLLAWLLEEELVEDASTFYSHQYNLNSYYFGPELGQVQPPSPSSDSEDLSLNSLSSKSSPVRFLRAPLYDLSPGGLASILRHYRTPAASVKSCRRCERGTCRLRRHQGQPVSSSSSSCYSGSPGLRVKTSTPDTESELVLQRTVASNRLTFRNFVPGHDLRMRGDGCEGESYILSRDNSISSFNDLSISRSNSVSSSMMDIVLGARQVRRFIREISLDSQESDIDIETETDYRDYSRDYREHNNNSQQLGYFCDKPNTSKPVDITENTGNTDTENTGEEYRDSDGEPRLKKESSVPDFKLIERKTGINRRLWKLTGFSDKESLNLSEFSDADNASMEWESPGHAWSSPSLLSPSVSVKQEGGLEWDNEFSAESLNTEDLAEYSRLWLKDLEFSPLTPHSQYLSRASSRRSSTDTELRYMTRYPPSGRSSVGPLTEDDIPASASVSLSAQKYKFQNSISRSRSGSFNKSGSVSPASETFWEPENAVKNIMNSSLTSQESGFQDCESSLTSSVCSVNSSILTYNPTPLSPVKEDKEPRSPVKVLESSVTLTRYGDRATAALTDSELLIVTDNQSQEN